MKFDISTQGDLIQIVVTSEEPHNRGESVVLQIHFNNWKDFLKTLDEAIKQAGGQQCLLK